jgi:branched-chain amino acid transport system ATP-binding protein
LLTVREIQVRYGRVAVIHSLSLHIDPGEVVAVLGPNGAGKTTLVRSILGLVPPAKGEIRFAGEVISRLRPHQVAAKGIAVVPEGRGIFPKMVVEENLKSGLVFFGGDPTVVQERLEEAYRRFPVLRERRQQVAGTLSGGEQSMLSISRAMMRQPKLLLMDEPSLGLSPKLVEQTFAIVRELHRGGTSILLIEQNARQALSVCQRGYILQKGAIVLSGSRGELLSDERVQRAYFAGEGFGASESSPGEPTAEYRGEVVRRDGQGGGNG